MPNDTQNQLRQIKWLLAGILACLVVIVFAMVPGLLALLLAVVVTMALAAILWNLSQSVRTAARSLWREVGGLWGR
jgi:cobalamin biosynthesis protein CobD/CbiB